MKKQNKKWKKWAKRHPLQTEQFMRHFVDHMSAFNAHAQDQLRDPGTPRPWNARAEETINRLITEHIPLPPIFAETNLWFDHEPMLYVVKAEHLDRPYLFAKEEEADAFYALMRDRLPNSEVTVTTAWLFADYGTAFSSFEADIA